jgi:hypothetical protein
MIHEHEIKTLNLEYRRIHRFGVFIQMTRSAVESAETGRFIKYAYQSIQPYGIISVHLKSQ